MLNKSLKKQAKQYLGKLDQVPTPWVKWLRVITTRYDDRDRNSLYSNKPTDESPEAIKELNIKLKNEADELKKAHAELGRILNSVNHGFFSRDILRDNYIYLSLACERIYGYTAEEFVLNSGLWYDVIHPDDKSAVEKDFERLNNREQVYTQYRITRKDNCVRWVELTLIPSFKNNTLVRVDGVVDDITTRKEAEAEREAMLKELLKTNADLSQFSYITSHNLRSPLSNILGIVNLFDFKEDDVHNRRLAEMVKDAAHQLDATIEDLTEILIIKNNINPDPTRLSLEDTFHQVLQTFSIALTNIGGEVKVDFKSPFVTLNKVFLDSIFINLISNAIKYHSPNRQLIIQVESIEDSNGYVEVSFRDNGIGIDLNRHKGRIFGLYQRFHETAEGKGLGLFIIKSQIEAIGGKIAIESELDIGTKFILTLPR